MRKMFLIVLSLVIVSMFIVSCGTGQAVKIKNTEKQAPTGLQNICQKSLTQCHSQLKELQSGIKYRLFEEDYGKMGYQLQFYENGVVAAFGVADVVDNNNLVVELSGKDYDGTMKNVALGNTIDLTTKDNSKKYKITIEDIEATGGVIDVAIQD